MASPIRNMDQDIYVAIVKAIARQKNLEPASITPASSLEELSISSLDAITIVYELEELFDIEVPNENLEHLRIVQDIVDGIAKLIQPGG